MDKILKTTLEIIRSELPKNSNGYPVVLDRVVSGWFHGDRQIISNNELPAIMVDGESVNVEWQMFQAYQDTWNFSVSCYVRTDEADYATTLLNEMTRLLISIIKKHSRMWIFEQCIFDLKHFHSPAHLMLHSELDSIAQNVKDEWNAKWNATHRVQGNDTAPTPPTLKDEDAYVSAYIRYINSNNVSTNSFSYHDNLGNVHNTTVKDVVDSYIRDNISPVRLLSFVKIDSVDYGYVPKRDGQLLRASEIKISAKEINPMHEFGPNNVSDPKNW